MQMVYASSANFLSCLWSQARHKKHALPHHLVLPVIVHTTFLTFSGTEDIIDETLAFFKANVLFRNFEVKGPSDLLLIYLILYTSQCLVTIRGKNKTQAVKDLYSLSVSNFQIPGDGGFALGGLVAAPANRSDGGMQFVEV